MSITENRRSLCAVGLLALISLTLVLYGAVIHFQFVNYDDDVILLKNKPVQEFNLKTIFTKVTVSDYIPLTLSTYAVEYHFFGLDPFIYHLDNLILHVLNCILVAWLLFELTAGNIFVTFLVTLLFVVHPLHVESVAWVTQRKDVLCTFFTLLSLIFYLKYAKQSAAKKFYWISLLFFVAALLTKAMALTLPAVFILADFVLLKRKEKFWRGLVKEKVPFFVLSAAVVVLHLGIHNSEALISSANFSWKTPFTNAAQALAFYISKSLVPSKLSAFYRQGAVTTAPWEYWGALGVSAGAWFLARKGRLPETKPLVIFGGFFFLLSIAPVLQAVPYGNRFAYSDHYFYVPGIGLLLIYVCALREIWDAGDRFKMPRRVLCGLVTAAVVILFGFLTFERVKVWHDSETLWKDALEKYPTNPVAYFNLAGYYTFDSGRAAEALSLYDKEEELTPDDPMLFFNRGMALNKLSRPNEAVAQFEKALQLAPGVRQIYYNLGLLYGILGRPADAVSVMSRYEQMNPQDSEIHRQLAKAYTQLGQSADALREFRAAEELKKTAE